MSDNLTGWIIGTGPIGQEYAKILSHLGIKYTAIGRGKESANLFEEATGQAPIEGGCSAFLDTQPAVPDFAIVATSVDQMAEIANDLLDHGVKKLLLEKPGALNLAQLQSVSEKAREKDASVFIAYNRRYFSSALKAQEIIKSDGGVRSFHFDFTEWPSRILAFTHPEGVLENWFYMNSSHVVDLAFHLGGKPETIHCLTAGELSWHSPAIFSGTGTSQTGAVFSYKADWESAGRWSLEIMTPKRKLIFSPMEQLKEQLVDKIDISPISLDDRDDIDFKPGFLNQTKAFLQNTEKNNLLTLEDQLQQWKIFDQICGRGEAR